MDSSDSGSEPRHRSWLRQVVAVGVFVVLGSSLLVGSTAAVEPTTVAVAGAILGGIAIVLLWRRATADPGPAASADADEATDDSDVWNAIPSWQYEGRHVESGGLTRGEQERALEGIQQRADELDEDSTER